jgi:hypothetical protein
MFDGRDLTFGAGPFFILLLSGACSCFNCHTAVHMGKPCHAVSICMAGSMVTSTVLLVPLVAGGTSSYGSIDRNPIIVCAGQCCLAALPQSNRCTAVWLGVTFFWSGSNGHHDGDHGMIRG